MRIVVRKNVAVIDLFLFFNSLRLKHGINHEILTKIDLQFLKKRHSVNVITRPEVLKNLIYQDIWKARETEKNSN